MAPTFVTQLFNSIADTGRELLDLRGDKKRNNSIKGLCRDLLTQKGEASGMALARDAVAAWNTLTEEEKLDFLYFLNEEMAPDQVEIEKAVAAYHKQADAKNYKALTTAIEAPRQELMRRLNFAPGGTAAIVAMRKFLVGHLRTNPELKAVDSDLQHLLSSWFNRGFLTLERIDWRTPAVVLEKLIEYEAVHEIDGWDDLRRRLDKDRRCFAFFHPALPDEPLIFVEVALVKGLAAAIPPLLSQEAERGDPTRADTAIFYSISNCQDGLKGISFGNFLIKQVVAELSAELPNLKHFATLSPIPGFMRWLNGVQGAVAGMHFKELREIRDLISEKGWQQNPEIVEKVKGPLEHLCAHYLVNEKSGERPLDPVTRFHLGNGARLEQLNWLGDDSENGMKQSAGLLVNYYYSLRDIEKNHEAYANERKVVASSAIQSLAK
ncbi:malonyl-CoA decarboxylase [uncultured Sneathiella sp.]|uniref:malonyl-CoA decarboxylase n=1 Tax=uncultured Sneathiella sp. TaxID=879315 RepID=UPI0030EDB85D|tara:strand:- start:4799 stop:6109 length:1311 start_codon:yes stop_codon:yes gene_type:complete